MFRSPSLHKIPVLSIYLQSNVQKQKCKRGLLCECFAISSSLKLLFVFV